MSSDTSTTDEVELEEPPVSIRFEHCQTLYRKMLSEAKMMPGDGEEEMVVWEGHLTKLITKDLHFSTPYYTYLTVDLKRMGSIRQVRRGGGSAPSVWELITEPTEELFKHAEALRQPGKTTEAMLGQQMRNLGLRLADLEAQVAQLISAFTKEE